jgi:hypothetical protein
MIYRKRKESTWNNFIGSFPNIAAHADKKDQVTIRINSLSPKIRFFHII